MESGSTNQIQENEEDISNSGNETITPSRRAYDPNHFPISLVAKIMRKVLPKGAKISEESKEIVQEAVTQFIRLMTTEANKHSNGEIRKTIGAEDLLFALQNKGFNDYVGPLSLFLQRYRQSENPAYPQPLPPTPTPTHTPPPPPQTQPQGSPQVMVTNNEQSVMFPPLGGASGFNPFHVRGMFPNLEYQPLPPQSPAPPFPYNFGNDMGFPHANQAMAIQPGMNQFTNMSPLPPPQGYDLGMGQFTNILPPPLPPPQVYNPGMGQLTNMPPPPPPPLSQVYGPGMNHFTNVSPPPLLQEYDPRTISTVLPGVDQENIQNYGSFPNGPHDGTGTNPRNDAW